MIVTESIFSPENINLIIVCSGALALFYGLYVAHSILKLPAGTARMQEIAGAIQEGAQAYLNRQYQTIAVVGAVVTLALWPLMGMHASIGFVLGAVLSGIAGYIGMYVSVRANVRTAEAARTGLERALSLSFKSGAVTGMLVVGLGLLGIAFYYYFLQKIGLETRTILEALVSLSFGASLISIFARLGGGSLQKVLMLVLTLLAKLKQVFQRMTQETLRLLQIT